MANPFKKHINSTGRMTALLLIFFFPLMCIAEPAIRLEVSPKSGTPDDRFLLSVMVEGSQERPVLRGGDDFQVDFVGPRTEVSILNGRMTSRTSYIYSLTPKREGRLLTPGAQIGSGPESIKADPVTVTVNADPTMDQAQASEVMLQQSVIPSTVYIGQQIINNIDLLYSVQIRQPQADNITYDDFWAEELSNQSFQRAVAGQRFNVLRLRRALYPLKSGPVVIPSRRMTLAAITRHRRRSLFDNLDPFTNDFFSGFMGTMDFQQVTTRSNSVSINVIPLPPAPEDFPRDMVDLNLSGETIMEASLQQGAVKTGESKTLTVTIKSLGNLNPLATFQPVVSGPARVYAEEPEAKSFEDAGMISMVKTLRYSIIPTGGGLISIETPAIPWFDTVSNTWKKAAVNRISFEALPSASQADEISPEAAWHSTGQKTVPAHAPAAALHDTSVPAPYEEPGTLERLSKQVSTGLALLAATIIFAVGGLVFLVVKMNGSLSSRRQVLKTISGAQNPSDFFAAVETALRLIFKCPSGCSLQAVRLKIQQSETESGLKYRLTALIDEIEVLRFGGHEISGQQLAALKERAVSAVEDVNR